MTRSRSTRPVANFVALSCFGIAASQSAPALAQDSAAAPTRLEGVTVTDTAIEESYRAEQVSPKATAPLIDTPRIVNIVPEQVLQDTASFSLEGALRTVPGITLGAGEGGVASADIPLIRGIDATGSVFVDGLRDVGSQTREVFAVEQIEVIKGASSAFGGRGTAAGAINMVSKVARDGNRAEVRATAGTSDLVRITADVNAQVADKLAVRVVGLYHDSKVAGRDFVHDDRWGVLPSISWGVGTPWTATLSYYHYETDAMPDYGIPLTSRRQLEPDAALPDTRRPADVDHDNFYGLLARDFQKTKTDSVAFQFDGDLGGGIILSHITRYSRDRNNYIVTNPDDTAGNVANGYVWRNTKSRDSTFQGIASNTNLAADFDTGSISHTLSAGFEFSVADNTNRTYTVDTGNYRYSADPASPTPGCLAPDALTSYNCTTLDNPDPRDPWAGSVVLGAVPAKASAEDYSFYVFDTVTIVPQLLLNGGIRWTSYSAKGEGTSRGVPFSARNSGKFWTWQAGVVFKPTDDTSIYASYADAKTPPGTTVGEGGENLSATNGAQRPQAYENWEVGAKAELFAGNLLLSAAAFRIDRSNIVQTDGGVVTNVFDSARLEGFELGVSGQAGPVSMMLGYTYVDSELRGNSDTTIIGNVLPQTPKHNFAATVRWQATPQFGLGGGAYGASRRYADPANLISANGYTRFDAFAEYEINDRFGVQLNVQNLTDNRYIVKLRNPHFAVPAAGRQALVTLSAKY